MYSHERSLVNQLSDRPFELIGVNSDKDLEMARSAVKENKLPWRSFWNGEKGTQGPISVKWNIERWPTLYVIDAKGIIRYKNISCLLYTSPSPRDLSTSRMPSSA